MLFQETTPTGLRGAAVGFAEGFLGLALVAGVRAAMSAEGLSGRLAETLAVATTAGVVFAVGRGVCGKLIGAGIGAGMGLFLATLFGGALLVPDYVKDPLPAGQAVAFSGPGLDGKEIHTADLKGKVVLVDFWATWCGPCVQEMPDLRNLYDAHHADGFAIVGVSLDADAARLKGFVEARTIPWPQIFFPEPERSGWDNPLVRRERIDGIPSTFLIDRDGNLAARDLRGKPLADEVARLLGKSGDDVTPRPFRLRFGADMTRLAAILGLGAVVGGLAGALANREIRRVNRRADSPAG